MSDPPDDSSGEPAEADSADAPADAGSPEPRGDDARGSSAAGTAESGTDETGPPESGVAETATAGEAGDDGPEDEQSEAASYDSTGSGMRARDVEVPMRVYKTVTVFSTLIAVVSVVGGFILLDRATNRAQLPLSEVDPVVALAGIATILLGAATYAFGTRFRARGMGRSKNDGDDDTDNG